MARDHVPALTERYLVAVERRVDLDAREGRRVDLVAELRALTARHPLREPLWCRLISAMADQGRQAEALETYETLRTTLADELGTDPSPDLQQLHRRLLAAEPSSAEPTAVEPDVAGDDDAGPDALRRLAPVVPQQLPAPPPGFVGRARELAALDDLVNHGDNVANRVIAIHGPGGIGKTSLALHWAHRVRDRFPDGQLYLNLEGYGPQEPESPTAALGMVLRALGVPSADLPASVAERSAILRTISVGRRMLVLLDNARDVEQVRPLLPGSDSVVVITSRSRLRGLRLRDGARGLSLEELDRADALELLAGHVGQDRVAADPAAAGRLVEVCGRHPLALRLAAEYAAGFADTPFSTLVDNLRGWQAISAAMPADDIDTDLRAVFSWSYDALPADVGHAFRWLGLHPSGDLSAEPTAALLDVPLSEAHRLLHALSGAHLVKEPAPGRYRMHDLIRDYALARLRAEDGDVLPGLRRLLDWYVHALAAANRLVGGGPWRSSRPAQVDVPASPMPVFESSAAAQRWLEVECATLVAATRVAAEHGLDRHVCELARRLHTFLSRQGHQQDHLDVGELALASARRLEDSDAICASALVLGWGTSDEIGRAEPLLSLALRLAESDDNNGRVHAALNGLAVTHYKAGDHSQAIGFHERAVRVARETGRPGLLGQALGNYAYTMLMLGRYAEAVERAEHSLRLYQADGGDFERGFALRILAHAHHRAGELATAAEYCDVAIPILEKLAEPSGLIDALTVRGRLHAAAGRRDRARADWRSALGLVFPHQHGTIDELEQLLAELDG